MKKEHLEAIYNFTIDFKNHIQKCTYENKSINNKKLDKNKDMEHILKNMLDQYQIYKKHYFDNPDFFNLHPIKFSDINIMLDNRFKNSLSLYSKIERNLNLEGHMYFKKITNDIIGARIIFETEIDIPEIESALSNVFFDEDEIKIIDSSKNVGYKAVHIYISNKNMLPVELQIWRMIDCDENHRLHNIYKQKHFKENND